MIRPSSPSIMPSKFSISHNSSSLKSINSTLKIEDTTPRRIKWNLKESKIKYFNPPRYLIVEDTLFGRTGLGKLIKTYTGMHFIDMADNGPEAVEKFSKLISQGYIYDYIFMDIEIPHINGIDVANYIRDKEKIFGVHTNIAAVTVREPNEIPAGLFDEIGKLLFNNISY